MSYDNYHQKADRIFQLTTQLTVDGKEDHTAWAPNFINQQLKADYPEVEEIIRLQASPSNISFKVAAPLNEANAPRNQLDQVYTVHDPAFLTVFTYPRLTGDPKMALARPGCHDGTGRVARKLLGPDWNPRKGILGQLLRSEHLPDHGCIARHPLQYRHALPGYWM